MSSWRDSMRCRSSPSGPSKTGSATENDAVPDRDGDARIGLDRDRLHAAQLASSAAFSAAWSGASVSRGCPRMKDPVRGSHPALTAISAEIAS